MATPHGQPRPDLNELFDQAQRVDFFQALRLLSREPGKIRVRPELSLGFPASDITRIEKDSSGDHAIYTNFLSLYGSASPLPAFYTEDLFRDDSPATREFIDLIHQRLYNLFFRAWKKNRLFIWAAEDQNPDCLAILYALCGADSYGWVRYTGLMGGHPRSAVGLETLLTDLLTGPEVTVVPFVAREVSIPADQQLHLGVSQARLGEDSFIGQEFVDRQGKFRIRIGSLDRSRFRRLLQGSVDYARLIDAVEHYLNEPLEYELELNLDGTEVEPILLGADQGTRLGLDTALFAETYPGTLTVVFPNVPPERIAA